eukprot:3039047-Rhodomonas_salina.2
MYNYEHRPTGHAVGSYMSGHAATACVHCASTRSTRARGSTSLGDCKCVPGLEGSGTGSCMECMVGTYKEAVGSEACAACPGFSNATSLGSASLELHWGSNSTPEEAVLYWSRRKTLVCSTRLGGSDSGVWGYQALRLRAVLPALLVQTALPPCAMASTDTAWYNLYLPTRCRVLTWRGKILYVPMQCLVLTSLRVVQAATPLRDFRYRQSMTWYQELSPIRPARQCA